MKTRTVGIAAAFLLASGLAWASGGGSAPMGGSGGMSGGATRMTPEQEAAMHYNNGLKAQEKADKLNQEAAAVRQSDEALSAAKAQLADLGSGKRGAELEVVKAQLDHCVARQRA